MSKELGIFVGRYNTADVGQLAARVAPAEVSFYYELKELDGPDVDNYSSLAIAGGDGTVRMVIAELHRKKCLEKRPIFVISGGTSNAMYAALTDSGASVGVKEIVDGALDGKMAKVRPGMIAGYPFLVDAGAGTFEARLGYIDEILRSRIGGSARIATAAAFGWVLTHADEKQPAGCVLDFYSLTPYFGRKMVIPRQETGGDLITRTYIDGVGTPEVMAKLLIAIYALGAGLSSILQAVTKSQTASEFVIDRQVGTVRTDGDLKIINPQSGIVVGRIPEKIKIAALNI